jgi:glycosylphosphatidylinositol transamidase (GPIT) subunit GPI8
MRLEKFRDAACNASIVCTLCLVNKPHAKDAPCAGDVWALLIAGSAGWGNYRHQADVLHVCLQLISAAVPNLGLLIFVLIIIAAILRVLGVPKLEKWMCRLIKS